MDGAIAVQWPGWLDSAQEEGSCPAGGWEEFLATWRAGVLESVLSKGSFDREGPGGLIPEARKGASCTAEASPPPGLPGARVLCGPPRPRLLLPFWLPAQVCHFPAQVQSLWKPHGALQPLVRPHR